MKQTIQIAVNPDVIDALKAGNEEEFQKLLASNIEANEEHLESFLQGFCTRTRETYSSSSLHVDCVEYDDMRTGTISLSFTGDAYMGCKDADYLHDHWESLTYSLDVNDSTITLEGEFEDEREPDEI